MRIFIIISIWACVLTGCATTAPTYYDFSEQTRQEANKYVTDDYRELKRRWGDLADMAGHRYALRPDSNGRVYNTNFKWLVKGVVLEKSDYEYPRDELLWQSSHTIQWNPATGVLEFYNGSFHSEIVWTGVVQSDGAILIERLRGREKKTYRIQNDNLRVDWPSDGTTKILSQADGDKWIWKYIDEVIAIQHQRAVESRENDALIAAALQGVVQGTQEAMRDQQEMQNNHDRLMQNVQDINNRAIEQRAREAEAAKRQEQMRSQQVQQSKQAQTTAERPAANQHAAKQAEATRQKEAAAAQAAKKAAERQARSDRQNREAQANAQAKMQAFVASTQANGSSKVSLSPKANEKQDDRPEARAWCRQSKRGKFTCWGPLQKLGSYEDTLQAALKLVDCDAGVGYTPPPGGSGESFRCIGRKVEPYDEKIPAYDPYAGENS